MIEFSNEVNLQYHNVVYGLSSLLAAVEEPVLLNQPSSPRKSTTAADFGVASSSSSSAAQVAAFATMVHIRREVLSVCKFFESFITTLSADMRQKNFLLPVMIPSARSVPFPQETMNMVTPLKPSHIRRPTASTKSISTALPPVHNPIRQPSLPTSPASRLQHASSVTPAAEPEQDLSQRIIIAGLYVAFDAISRILRARDGHVSLIRNYEEAQAICVFGEKYRLAPELRLQLKLGPVGVVMRSGIAANISPPLPTADEPNLLCVPLRRGLERHNPPIGAVTFTRGGDAFSPEEEGLAASWAVFAQQLVTGYGVDHMCLGFDPMQTLLRPASNVFQHLKQLAGMRAGADDVTSILRDGSALSDATTKLIGSQQPADLVFRSTKPSEFIAVRGGRHVSGSSERIAHLTFSDIADYVERLEKCWGRAQSSLHSIESEQIQQLDELRKGRRKTKDLLRKAEEEGEKSEMYQKKFEALKSQLESVIEKQMVLDSPAGKVK
jgi:hypothetical protein